MRAIDTNVLIRLLARDDERQVAAAETFVARGAWVSHIVLVEAMWVLVSVYDRKPPDIATAVTMLLDHKNLVIQEPEVVARALARFRKKPSIGFPDCLVLETARKNGQLPLGSFDRALGKQDGAHHLTVRV